MTFGDSPLGDFPGDFLGRDLGCALNVVCFVLFVIAVLIFWRFVLN
jgi:hypothetical protein